MERWNKIVQWREKVIDADERIIQRMWENLFLEVFKYSSMDGEIDSQRKLRIGAANNIIPDIVIMKDKKDLFAVELKRCTIPFCEGIDEQIKSYMKQLQLKIGLLICSEIYIYVNKDGEFKRFCISFTSDNCDGRDFIELFKRDNFSVEKIEKYVNDKTNKEKKVKEILGILDSNFAGEIIKNYLNCEGFDDDDIESALEKLTITVEKKLNLCAVTGIRPKTVAPVNITKTIDHFQQQHANISADTTKTTNSANIKELKTGAIIKARTHAEFLNQVFGTNYIQWMQSVWNYNPSTFVWMVRLDGKVRSGWRNILLSENEIREENANRVTMFKGKPVDTGMWRSRIVIDVVKNGGTRAYTFRGIFKYEENKSDPYNVRYYKKISDTFTLK